MVKTLTGFQFLVLSFEFLVGFEFLVLSSRRSTLTSLLLNKGAF